MRALVSLAVISFLPVENATSARDTVRKENSTRIRALLGAPRGCCPYAFNGFHGTGLIALASTRASVGRGDSTEMRVGITPNGCAIFA